MNVRVQLFAAARDRAGVEFVELTTSGSTVADVRAELLNAYPSLEPIAAHLLFAVGDSYGTDATRIPEGSRVACFPPVSGG